MMRVLRFTIRVENQDEALRFYTDKLGFVKRSDMRLGPMHWLTVAPPDEPLVELVLQPSDWFQGEERRQHAALVGKDPTIVFQVDDCRATYEALRSRGVEFSAPPADQPYGVEAVARDLYGNTLDFLQLPAGR
jgi:predicted enzyme related to lactoylglutathione lyase